MMVNQDVIAFWMALAFKNFSLTMLLLALIIIAIKLLFNRNRRSVYEIFYRWIAVLPLGVTGIYTFVVHAFYSDLAASSIGWQPSPFQFEVAVADLTIGVLGILSFKASYGFRLATVIAASICLLGDAAGHIYQMIVAHNFAPGNAGSWFWLDIIIPIILLICIFKLKPGELMVT